MDGDTITRLNAALEGRYRVEREAGEGGMANVYLAKDLRHNRLVALKVLKPELAVAIGADRFLAEIETTASLQHPHILPLFDSGEADGVVYYVMPYVDGESLRDRLDRVKHLPVEEAVDIATAVANALDYAHRHDVVHRDIKPANILLHDGEPVIADFGVALAVRNTDEARITKTGFSLGTPEYMSPEQATGARHIDGRADIYALGCMLYEMLAGQSPHASSTAPGIIAKILTEDARPVTELRPAVPRHVASVLRKALERIPADRFQRAGAFAKALKDRGFRYEGSGAGAGSPSADTRWWRATAIGASALAALALITLARAGGPSADELPLLKVSLALSGEELVVPANGAAVTLSGDGSTLLYGAHGGSEEDGRWRLWARRLDQLDATPLVGTEEGVTPAFSPDGTEVAFTLAAQRSPVQVMPLAGGMRRTVGPDVIRAGLAWAEDDRIYFARIGGGISRMRSDGTEVEIVTTIDSVAGETGHRWLNVLPGAEAGVFSVSRVGGEDGWTIAAVRFGTGEHHELGTGLYPRYLRSGHLIWTLADGTLMAAPFDADALELTGRAVPVLDRVNLGAFGAADVTVSDAGTLVYVQARTFDDAPVWVSRDGAVAEISGPWDGSLTYPRISPDGRRMAIGISRGSTASSGSDIWVKELDTGFLSRLTFGGSSYRPWWTPDGLAVTYLSDQYGQGVWITPSDGSGAAQLLYDDLRYINEAFYTSDGEWLVYRLGSGGDRDLFARRMNGSDETVPLATSEFEEANAAVSPDGRWLAYSSNESGQNEIYVRPFPEAGSAKHLVSMSGGREPLWAYSGQELFYKNTTNQLVSVAVETEPTFRVVRQTPLFSTVPYKQIGFINSYDVSLDDERFLMIRSRSGIGDVKLIQNLFREIEQKLGDGSNNR